MKNFVQPGENITVSAPYALASGAGALVGALFGVAANAAENGATVVLKTEGVFDLPKVGSQAWTVGAKVYWDNTNKYLTTTSAGNTLVGVAMAAVGSGAGETTGRARLGIVA